VTSHLVQAPPTTIITPVSITSCLIVRLVLINPLEIILRFSSGEFDFILRGEDSVGALTNLSICTKVVLC
jgi:hypothetical protein